MRPATRFALAMMATALTLPLWGARPGEPAPDFTATDTYGRTHRLSDYRGKFVVLEWQNRGCPYTRKHYETGNMQRLQKQWTARGVVWLTIISSAPGKQGYMTAEEANQYFAQMGAASTAVLLDPQGTIGHLYDARTTPEIYIIDPKGVLIYQGAIDDKPTTNPEDIKTARNYVDLVLSQALAGQPVTISATRPYGCSVKYADE
jgi:peroxiredoxin